MEFMQAELYDREVAGILTLPEREVRSEAHWTIEEVEGSLDPRDRKRASNQGFLRISRTLKSGHKVNSFTSCLVLKPSCNE